MSDAVVKVDMVSSCFLPIFGKYVLCTEDDQGHEKRKKIKIEFVFQVSNSRVKLEFRDIVHKKKPKFR